MYSERIEKTDFDNCSVIDGTVPVRIGVEIYDFTPRELAAFAHELEEVIPMMKHGMGRRAIEKIVVRAVETLTDLPDMGKILEDLEI